MVPEKGAWSTLTMIDKHMHRPRRKMMSKALSDDALKVYEPEMVEHVNILLGLLGEGQRSDGWSSPKDMSAICMRLTLDVMCDFGFGQKVGLQTDRSLDYIPKALQNYSWRMGIYEQYPQLASLGVEKCASCFSYGLELKEKFQNWSENFASNVLTRDGSKQQGQFSIIRDSKDAITGKGLSDLQLWAEGSFMMLAGSDTTAIAMSAIFFYLAHYSEVYEKLVDEIHNTFSDLSQIRSGATLNSCSYLSACITETMRISPPVPGIPWREVEGDGVFLDGKQIPSGYNVGTSIYSIQHNPAFFPSPHTFIPSRWLPTDPLSEAETTAAYSALNPFSLGPRGCAGRSMALLELRLTVARVLFTYELRMADGELGTVGEGMLGQGRMRGKREEFQLFSNVTSYCRGPWLMFRERGERK
ncbi:MAG: hypothetical protein M1827_004627 [Pycnora praestabilis]|nr:MAG: hypothetical protein M1827_004627 [Pycnora praestabilis]